MWLRFMATQQHIHLIGGNGWKIREQIWEIFVGTWADSSDKSSLSSLFGVILASSQGSWKETAGVSCWWRLLGSLPVRLCFHPGHNSSHPSRGQIAGPWFSALFLGLQQNPQSPFWAIWHSKSPPWASLLSVCVFSFYSRKSHTLYEQN